MRTLNVGIIQQRNSENILENSSRIANKIRELSKKGAQLIVNQELHDTLYFCQTESVDEFDKAIQLNDERVKFYQGLARETKTVLIISLFEKRASGLYHNTAIVIEKDGSLAGKYRKMHIPDDPAYYEKFYFTPGDLGFHAIDTSVGRLGVLVCWDQWYPEAARLMALDGAEVLIYPTAIGTESTDSPEEQQRQLEAWTVVQRGHAVANGVPVISVNRVGHEPDPSKATNGITFWGSSFVAGPQGEILYRAPFDKEATEIVKIDMNRSDQVRRWWPFFRDRRIDAYSGLTSRYLD
ncbi:MAG: carbon-nitrogen hydrolase [Muribaculaceae bacterium]|nr:carbon-nitrogen hydrolase [Muribaculaceae bacterium]